LTRLLFALLRAAAVLKQGDDHGDGRKPSRDMAAPLSLAAEKTPETYQDAMKSYSGYFITEQHKNPPQAHFPAGTVSSSPAFSSLLFRAVTCNLAQKI